MRLPLRFTFFSSSGRMRRRIGRATPPRRWPRSDCTRDELQLLCYLAEHEFTGEGEIWDVGCGNGGSTFCLCEGLRSNPREQARDARVHAVDRFESSADSHWSGATVATFAANTAGCEDRVVVHSTDITCFRWPGPPPPLEILFIDVAKEEHLFTAVVRSFFQSFLPGRSIVVHQDFGRPRLSWLHYSSMMLLPYMRIIAIVDDSLVLRVDRQPDAAVLARILDPSLDVEEKVWHVAAARRLLAVERSRGVSYDEILGLSEAYVWLYAGRYREALRALDDLRLSPAAQHSFRLMIDQVRAACRRRLGFAASNGTAVNPPTSPAGVLDNKERS